MGKIYPETIGLHITLNTGINLDLATETLFIVTTPSLEDIEWTASKVAGTQDLEYYTVEGDLPEAGKYKIRTHVVKPGFEGDGETYYLNITPLGY